jgi:RNA polymerase sigma-70 factor (ECF subfamily)
MPDDTSSSMSEPPKESPHAWLLAALARFERPLVRYAFSLCSDLEQSRDAVQDTFLRLSREPPRRGREDIESLAPWLFTVCRHRVIDLHRKTQRLVSMETEVLDRTASETAGPDGALDEKETAGRIHRMIAELPPKQRQVIKLKFETGLSYKEISAATGLSTGNIGWLIHQAVQSLRNQWQHENA